MLTATVSRAAILSQPKFTMHFPKWFGIELIEVSSTEKLIAAVAGGFAILALIWFSTWALPGPDATAIITSMGASAVLLFAVPHGQLSQPWPVLAGHGVSAFLGVACAQTISDPWIAAACAVGFSIGAMIQLRCIHPPGGATAFAAVMGGSAIHDLGFSFVLFPVLSNALFMVSIAVLISIPFRWRRYPVSLSRPEQTPQMLTKHPAHDDVLKAIRTIDSFVDISEEDLIYLIELLAASTTEKIGIREERRHQAHSDEQRTLSP